jgi:DNA-binding transcriptional regulator YiaG
MAHKSPPLLQIAAFPSKMATFDISFKRQKYLSTLQKWERGVAKPTPPVNRLFQLVEKGRLELIRKK